MNKYKNSLVVKITIGTVLVVAIMFTILIISNVYSLYVVKSNIVNSTTNTLNIYINNMDNILNNAVSDLDEIVSNVDDFSGLSGNEAVRYFASIRILDVLKMRINSNKNSDVLIVYNADHDIYLADFSYKINSSEKSKIALFVKSGTLENKDRTNLWSIATIYEDVYFYRIYSFTDTKIISFVKADTLMSLVDTTAPDSEELFILTDLDGHLMAADGNKSFLDVAFPLPNDQSVVNHYNNKYMMVSKKLDGTHARLTTILKEKNVLLGLSFIQWIIIALGIISLIVMPFIVYYLEKEIIMPINRLIAGTRQIERGNLDYQVEIHKNSKEFLTLTHAFNTMVKDIKNLKISYYEEQIELQKAELKYLQMQLRPHFFLNAITTIHSLTYKNNDEIIRSYIDALSRHLRYMFKGSLSEVTVGDEIKHVKNYLSMQEIRFPGSVFYMVDMPQEIENNRIPQFLILTFLENAFKHAMTLEETLSIFIKIERTQLENDEVIHIMIEDSGEGFSEEMIDKVNKNSYDSSVDGYKIGISNIKRTLALLYGKNNLLMISNAEPNGAKIDIMIPIGVESR